MNIILNHDSRKQYEENDIEKAVFTVIHINIFEKVRIF